jgi:hypothetical protein
MSLEKADFLRRFVLIYTRFLTMILRLSMASQESVQPNDQELPSQCQFLPPLGQEIESELLLRVRMPENPFALQQDGE